MDLPNSQEGNLPVTVYGSVLAIALILNGCSLTSSYVKPTLPVALTYPTDTMLQAEAVSNGISPTETSWQQYFSDPYLQNLIVLALKNSRDMRSALLRVEEAHAVFGIQRADQFPNIGLQLSQQRSGVPADLNLTRQPLVTSQYQVGLGLASWELDFWGRVRNLKDAALENYLANDEAKRAFTISLITQVADGYLILRELNERILLAQQTITSREKSFHIFTRRVEVGSTSRMDLAQVETLLSQA